MGRRAALLLGSLIASLSVVLAFAAPASAEAITRIVVDVTVAADTSMHVVETIDYDFSFDSRHGIFRDLPVFDESITGVRRSYDITVNRVTADGQGVPWQKGDEGRYLRVKIGDPDRTMTGRHTYVIDYTVRNGLRVITADDVADPKMPPAVSVGDVEMYWDLVGTGWDVYISDASARVTGPAEPIAVACYWGPDGDTSTCASDTSGSTVAMGGIALGPNDGMTAAIVYPRAVFASTPVENLSQGVPTEPALYLLLGMPLALLFGLVPGFAALLLRRRDKGVRMEASPPQYAAPDDLSAAEMVAGWKGPKSRSDSRVLVATLVDLSARGWIHLATESGLVITRTGPGTGALREWEATFLDAFFGGQQVVALTKYDTAHTAKWHTAYDHLVSLAKKSGRRNPEGDVPDKRWNWLKWVALISFVLGFASIMLSRGWFAFALIPLGIGAFVGFLIARAITPRRETAKSAEFLAKVRGLQRVLDNDPASARREVAQRLGLPPVAVMATMLPFAIVFKLERSWMAQFPDLSEADLSTMAWGVTSMNGLNGMVSSTSSYAGAATTSPSSGSGGGGSSGGGGGGGGGGSW